VRAAYEGDEALRVSRLARSVPRGVAIDVDLAAV
jgi:hypothetical protein